MTATCHPPFGLTPLAFPEMTSVAVLLAPRFTGAVLMPYTTADGFYDTTGASLPAESVMFLNHGADWSARNSESGFVSASLVEKFGGVTGPAVQPLLSIGVVERARKGRVRIVPGKGITILNANESAPPARAETAPSARRTALYRAPRLKQALRARDRDRCRYCAVPVRWGAGRAADSAVWDWLDPDGPASAENVVTACKACCDARAGRPLKDSGMTLLAPPPEGCDASRDASDLEERSGDPSKRHCDASSGVLAGQKRHSDPGPIDRSRSDLDLSPRPKSKSKSKSACARGPQPGSPEFRVLVGAKFAEVVKVEIGPEVADVIAADVLGAREGVDNPLLYVQRAIENEADPLGRWLPGCERPAKAAPAALGWCGECDEIYRTLENEKGAVYDCPACSPKSFAAWEATAS